MVAACIGDVHTLRADDDSGLDGLVVLLAEVDDADFQLDLLKGMRDGLKGRKSVPMPKGWPALYRKLAKSEKLEVRETAKLLALTFGDESAFAELKSTMLDTRAVTQVRQAALEALVFRKSEEVVPHLHTLVSDKALCGCAIRGLATFDHENTPAAILACYGKLSPTEKQDAIATLTSRPAYAFALLQAIDDGIVPRSDVTAFTARQINTFPDEKLRKRLIEIWGEVRESSADGQALIAKYRSILTPDSIETADAREGRALFRRSCHQCHKLFGEGGDIGPDLTGANRANLDYVLENVLTPSAAIAKDYQLKTIVTVDGRLVSGIIKETSDNAITVQTATEKVVIANDDVEEISTSPVSMMPDGQWDRLSDDDVRDLVKYLATKEQVPLPDGFADVSQEQATGSE
jgi:putative heme-binding domain-containing protein